MSPSYHGRQHPACWRPALSRGATNFCRTLESRGLVVSVLLATTHLSRAHTHRDHTRPDVHARHTRPRRTRSGVVRASDLRTSLRGRCRRGREVDASGAAHRSPAARADLPEARWPMVSVQVVDLSRVLLLAAC